MPYTNPWSISTPPGTLPAAQIDTAIQQARLDIAERANTMIGAGGSFSNDPVIDGTTVKSLTALTTEVASKTTLSGLSAGRLIQALGASSIGNASLTNAELVALAATVASLAAPITGGGTITPGTSGTLFTITVPGVYLIHMYARDSASTFHDLSLIGPNYTSRVDSYLPSANLSYYVVPLLDTFATVPYPVLWTCAGVGVNSGKYSWIRLSA